MVTKPKSAVPQTCGIIGVVAFLVSAAIFKFFPIQSTVFNDVFYILLTTSLPMIAYELLVSKSYKAEDNGLDWSEYKTKLKTSLVSLDFYIRFFGFFLSFAVMFFLYFYLNQASLFYAVFYAFLVYCLPLFLIISIIYLMFIFPALENKRDGLWAVGALFVPPLWKQVDWNKLLEHSLSLSIKMFFLPLMVIYFLGSWKNFKGINTIPADIHELFSTLFNSLYLLDLGFAVIGYILSVRLLNSHVRWSDRHYLGWLFCLVCYAPFNAFFFSKFLEYHDGLTWNDWIGSYPTLYVAWSLMILFTVLVYVYATVNFGLRFSNLTHRGIITNGAYAYTKHPAYVSKNLTWWLMEVPFYSVSPILALKNTALIIVTNFIYAARARFEERTLMPDPKYKEYVEYIEKNGVFSKVKQKLGINA